MSLLRKALMTLSVCALGSAAYAQDTGDTNYATGLRTLVPASFMMNGHEQAASTTNCASCNTGSCNQGCHYAQVGIFGDFLYLRMRNGDVPYAMPVDGLGPQALPTGNVGLVTPFYEQGFRVGAWIAPMELLTVRGQYLSWNSDSHDNISAPDGSILQALTTHPGTTNAALDSLTASAEIKNELRIFDVDGLVRLVSCGPWTVQGVGGVRYAQLRQTFQANYSILGETLVDTSSYFQGVGPRVGLESDVWIKGGLAAYGKAYANFLLGDVTTSYQQANVFQDQLVTTGFKQTRLVTNLELELGLSYSCCCDHVRLSAGYMISSWSNMVSTNDLIDAVQTSTFNQNRNNLRDTLIIDGIVVHREVRF
jgi:hypothetical protein